MVRLFSGVWAQMVTVCWTAVFIWLIAATLDHKLLVDGELIPPVVQRGQPMTMVQHKYLFSTTRIPGERQDTVPGHAGRS